jgi:two-component system, sensor histidine kinase PdtaS
LSGCEGPGQRSPYASGVPTLAELVRSHTDLDSQDVAWLHLLQADWQIVADLSFADLVLWVPVKGGDPATGAPAFACVAQVRPSTAPTAYQDDQVGRISSGPEVAHLLIAREQGRIWRAGKSRNS